MTAALLVLQAGHPTMEEIERLLPRLPASWVILYRGPEWLLQMKRRAWNRTVIGSTDISLEDLQLLQDTFLIMKKDRGYQLIYEVYAYMVRAVRADM
jgi:hypothetical protein